MDSKEETCQLIYKLFIQRFSHYNNKFRLITLQNEKEEHIFYEKFRNILLPSLEFLYNHKLLFLWDYDYIEKSFKIIENEKRYIISGGMDFDKLLSIMLEPFIINGDIYRFYMLYNHYLMILLNNEYLINYLNKEDVIYGKIYVLIKEASNVFENEKNSLDQDKQLLLQEFLMYVTTYLMVNDTKVNIESIFYRMGINFIDFIEWFELNNLIIDKHLSSHIMDTIEDLHTRVLRSKKGYYKIL